MLEAYFPSGSHSAAAAAEEESSIHCFVRTEVDKNSGNCCYAMLEMCFRRGSNSAAVEAVFHAKEGYVTEVAWAAYSDSGYPLHSLFHETLAHSEMESTLLAVENSNLMDCCLKQELADHDFGNLEEATSSGSDCSMSDHHDLVQCKFDLEAAGSAYKLVLQLDLRSL